MNVSLNQLSQIYDLEISKRMRNRELLMKFHKNKFLYINEMKRLLDNGLYDGGVYHIFVVHEPKLRVIMSQSVFDKVINHYVTRNILMPKLEKYLCDWNCATRKDMGIHYAVRLLKKMIEKYKKNHGEFYFLKMDIKKYFYTIDHEVLLSLLKNDLTDDEYALVKTIVSSTNKTYVNKVLARLINKYNYDFPYYEQGKGLPIGNMTSQFLAVFYLAKLHHDMRHKLKLHFIVYMDDYIILHEDKEYLKKCRTIIADMIKNVYKLSINEKKTYISSSKKGVTFLGYVFKVQNFKTYVKLCPESKKRVIKGLKRSQYLFAHDLISFEQFFSSVETYKNSHQMLRKKTVRNLVELYR